MGSLEHPEDNTVYVLSMGMWSSASIVGVFTTLEAAKACAIGNGWQEVESANEGDPNYLVQDYDLYDDSSAYATTGMITVLVLNDTTYAAHRILSNG